MTLLGAEQDGERTPLLVGHFGFPATIKVNSSGKIYEYYHENLLNWRVLLAAAGTVLVDRRCWIVVVHCAVVAIGVASIILAAVPHARRLDTGKFDTLVVCFELFISFLLALYLGNAYTRWCCAVQGFKKFLGSIKQLMYTLRAVGVRAEIVDELQRLSVAACWILHAEIHNMQLGSVESRVTRWKKAMRALVKRNLLIRAERKEMEKDYAHHADLILGLHSTMVWTWIGQVMRKMRTEDNVTAPMYVRLLLLCQDCLESVEDLKQNLLVQFPFAYAQLLSVLVHLSNILVAVKCGIALGISLDEIFSDALTAELGNTRPSPALMGGFYTASQVCLTNILFLCIKPTLYQAFLVMAHAMCYPYGDELGHLPIETYIHHMELDLEVMTKSRREVQGLADEDPMPEKDEDEDSDGQTPV